jgi:hypothetical protein
MSKIQESDSKEKLDRRYSVNASPVINVVRDRRTSESPGLKINAF